MATLNLGRIKPVFRGAYNGATAYVVDDIVTSGGETFICILASTGNATSNATYWTKLAEKGTNGTDGTDVGATLTTQGDVLYRDGSGLQRLAIGTAGQALKVNSGATAPEWGTVSSDYVKIAENIGGTSYQINFQNVFTNTYNHFRIIGNCNIGSNNQRLDAIPLNSSNNVISGNCDRIESYYYRDSSGTSNNADSTWNNSVGSYSARLGWGRTDNFMHFNINLTMPWDSTKRKGFIYDCGSRDNSYIYKRDGYVHFYGTEAITGMRFQNMDGTGNGEMNISVYGMK